MGVNGHAEGHSGDSEVPDANGTSQHYHVAEDDQTLEEVCAVTAGLRHLILNTLLLHVAHMALPSTNALSIRIGR